MEEKQDRFIIPINDGSKISYELPPDPGLYKAMGITLPELPKGVASFFDEEEGLWPERFKYTWDFYEGLARVELEDGYTFVDEDHNIWPERFKEAWDFCEGLAAVELEDGWTFVDKNHNVCPERFKKVGAFGFDVDGVYVHNGLAAVELEDGWTFVDRNYNVWPERFKKVGNFDNGFAEVKLGDWNIKYIDKERRLYSKEEMEKLIKIYNNPSLFLKLPTEKFKDENFILGAILQVKNALIAPTQKKDKVDDDYVKTSLRVLNECTMKIQREFDKIEEQRVKSEKAKKEELIRKFNDFSM